VKGLYNDQNYKTLKKLKTLGNGKISHVHGSEHSENGYITESDLQIQGNPQQNCNDILHRSKKINPKIYMET
jgi:hypothetical protein